MRKASHARLKRNLLTVLALVSASGILYVYFYTGFLTISSYSIIGAPEEYEESIASGARLLAEEKIFFVLPGNRIVSYHDDELRTLIRETLPNTKNISIYPSGLHALTIKLEHFEPVFSVSDTHAIADDGTVYKELIPVADLPRLLVSSSSVIHPRMLAPLSELVGKLDTVLFPVRFVVVDDHNDIRLYDGQRSSHVILSSSADFDTVWSNVLSAIDTEPLKGKLERKEHLEYLDTRFGNKVFYKFTNGAVPDIIPPHDDTVATTTLQ